VLIVNKCIFFVTWSSVGLYYLKDRMSDITKLTHSLAKLNDGRYLKMAKLNGGRCFNIKMYIISRSLGYIFTSVL
jgi:hypothetical protein